MGFSEPVGRFYVAVGMDTSELRAEINRANRVMRKALGSEAISLSQDLAKAVTASVAGFAALGIAAVKMAADMEQVEVGFRTLLKSASAARAVMKDLKTFAAETPFEFSEIAPAARSLLAFGISAGDLIPTLTRLGDISSGIGQPIGQIAEIYGKARVQGQLFMEDINQLTGRGIPIIQELAKQFGVTESEVRKLVEKGRVHFSNLEQAVISLTSKTGMFVGGMQAQSQTVNGLLSTLRDDVSEIMRNIGEDIAKAFDLRGVIASMSESINKIRADYAKNGALLIEPFSKTTYAVVALSGAIAGALIPSLQLLKGWAVVAIVPLLPLAAKVAAVAVVLWGLYEIAYKLYDSRDRIAAFFEILTTGARMAYNSIREGFANLFADLAGVMRSSIQDSQIAQYLAEPLAKMQVAFHKMAQESRGNVKAALEEQQRAVWVLGRQYDGTTSAIVRMVQASGDWRTMLQSIIGQISQVIPAVGALARIMGQAATTYKPAGSAAPIPSPASGGGKSGRDLASEKSGRDLASEAKSISESIRSEWMQATKDEETILKDWYDKQLETLNKSKAASKTYHEDLLRLKETYLAKSRKLSERKQADEEKKLLDQSARNEEIQNQLAQELNDRIEAVKSGQNIEKQLWADYRTGDMQAYLQHLNQQNVAFMQSLRGRQEAMSLHQQLLADANRSSLSYLVEGYQTLYSGLTDALTGVITGAKSAAQAMKDLGLQLITMVVKWMVQRQLAATMSKGLEKAMTASSVASAAITAKAWAPAAAMVAAATFGASTASAAAGLTALSGLSRALARVAVPGMANGGVVTRPTLAMIGEGGGPEAVIPLDRAGGLGGETRVTLNVHNNTGTPAQARQQTTRNGQEVVVDLFLDAFARDVNGLRTVLKGA